MSISARADHGRAFDYSAVSSLGDRENQEDSFAVVELAGGRELLLVVADGMGGHVGGEIASQVAVNTFVDCFAHHTMGEPHRRLRIALIMANEALAEHIRQDLELDGMGTTLVAAHLSDRGLFWVSVGDSLLLLVRDGEVRSLNEDHSMAPVIERQFLAGKLTREEADAHPERNALLSVLTGWRSPDMIDCPEPAYRLRHGDRLIAASDGLSTLEYSDITELALANRSAAKIAEAMKQRIAEKRQEFQDNTAIALAVVC
jgi:serine/threonine protein phosphatase PrpC